MKKINIALLASFFLFIGKMNAQEGSYLLEKNPQYTLWWSVGTYKVNKSEIPVDKGDIVISAARNEYEPFQLVVHPVEKMENVRISVSSLSGKNGSIDPSHIKIYDVEYVYVRKPSIGAQVGWYPDPLPLNKDPRTLYPLENYPFFIDVYIPESTPAGNYKGNVTISWNNNKESSDIPFNLTVYNFSLPEKTTLRSSFGIDMSAIRKYHNLENDQELKQVYDLYLQEMHASRICPTNPFSLSPMKTSFSGLKWEGGIYDRSRKTEGIYSYKIVDGSLTKNIYARSQEHIRIIPGTSYVLSWDVLCSGKQDYAVAVKLFDPEGNWMIYDNILEVYMGNSVWKRDTLIIADIPAGAVKAEVTLYASFPSYDGSASGTTWFDNVIFTEKEHTVNLLSQGNFEVDIDKIDVTIDFEEFDKAGERYLDEFGFNAFHLPVMGMGGGTFYSRSYGVLSGFEQNTPEYNKLMKCYLSQVEKHLEEKGWLGREYVYWFDEPDEDDYPFVREGMNVLKNGAPEIKRFITEMNQVNPIMDITDICCTIWNYIDPEDIDSMIKQGKEFWSYLCTGPRPPWINLFIDKDAINLRMWCWMSYQYKLTGILVWKANYWDSNVLSEHGKLQNPWEDPMSYRRGYGTPLGKPRLWGNGDGRFFYPPNRDVNNNHQKFLEGPVRSVRLSILREGIEDYEYFVLLQNLRNKLNPQKDKTLIARVDALLHFDESYFSSGDNYTKNPLLLYERRQAIAGMIEKLKAFHN